MSAVDVLAVGQSFRLLDGTVITLRGIRKVERRIRGETETRAGREPVGIRMDDAAVYDCEANGVAFTNSAEEMEALARITGEGA